LEFTARAITIVDKLANEWRVRPGFLVKLAINVDAARQPRYFLYR
jgi:hypothetical protein